MGAVWREGARGMKMLSSGKDWQRRSVILIIIALGVLPLIVHQAYWMGVLVVALYYAILASSWNLLAGFGGQFSLAPATFSMLGGYTSALLNFYYDVPPLVGIIAAIVVTFVIGYLLGRVVLRMRGAYLALTTFAFLEVVLLIIQNSYSVTRGEVGLSIAGIFDLSRTGYYYLFIVALIVTQVLIIGVLRSRVGLFIQAVRDDELSAASRGVDVVRWKVFLFSFSSALCGFAGALYVHFISLATPSIGDILQSGLIISMAVIGGYRSLPGPIIGAVLVEVCAEGLRSIGVQHMLVFAMFLILIIRFFPTGLWGGIVRINYRPQRSAGDDQGRNAKGDAK